MANSTVGGSEGREEAPGRSVAIITQLVCEYYDRQLENTTVAVQGYGSVGANAARLLDWGATVVAISDVNGTMYEPAGIDTAAVPSHDEEPGITVNVIPDPVGFSQLTDRTVKEIDTRH